MNRTRFLVLAGVAVLVGACGPTIVVQEGPNGAVKEPFRCEVQYPKEGSWYAECGYGKAGAEVDAIALAQKTARENLLKWAGANLTEMERRELEAAIDTAWIRPTSRCAEGVCEACAVALARKRGVGADDAVGNLKAGLEAKLVPFLQEVTGQANGGASLPVVRVVPPTWPGSMTASDAGKMMFTQVWGTLGECLPKVGKAALAKAGSKEWDYELVGELTLQGTGCALALSYGKRGQQALVPLGAVPFHPKAIGLTECRPPKATAASDDKMGLVNGKRPGSGGLELQLDAPINDGMLCEGDKFAWHVEASQPAFVRIYSVADDGRVLLGWQSPTAVTSWQPSETSMAIPIRMEGNVEYRLVAVAVPEALGRDGFGDAVPPPGCMAGRGTGFSAQQLPAGAAVAALTFGVTPAGEGDCGTSAQKEGMLRTIRENLKKLKECAH